MVKPVLIVAALLIPVLCFGVETIPADDYFGSVFTAEQRAIHHNESGSCVYFSVSAAGMYQNCPAAWTMPWESQYGAECRYGSYPSRFEADARRRGLDVLSVTGEQTYDYMRWALRNDRWAAAGVFVQHFQTVVGYDDAGTPDDYNDDTWYVWNCNECNSNIVRKYTNDEFKRYHRASGEWCIIIRSTPDRPCYPERQVK